MKLRRLSVCMLLGAALQGSAAVGMARTNLGLDRQTMELIESGEQFTDSERELARQILTQADDDESVLDVIVSSGLVSERDKQLARNVMERGGLIPPKVTYVPPPQYSPFELVSRPLRFHGDLSYQARDIRRRNDVSNYFSTNNARLDPGFSNVLEGRIVYAPEGQENPDVHGYLDLKVQTRDFETEVVNAYMHNRDNWYAIGTWLEPDFSEFGLRNTEISGTMGHFRRNKWMIDLAFGETVEDYVRGLDSLETSAIYIRREIGHQGRDVSGLSYYYANEVNYLGMTQHLQLHKNLMFRGEFQRRESTVNSLNQGNAWEIELDYENEKVLFQNEIQRIGSRYSSTLNPQYAYFTGQASDKENAESAFTYRFDPYVASSLTMRRNVLDPVGNRPEQVYSDLTWSLSTQRPDRPKYMFVIKGSELEDNRFSVDDQTLIGMARTTFKARDILTNIEVMRTDYDHGLQPRLSFIQNSMGFEISRPFLQKLNVSHRVNLVDQEFTDPVLSNESLAHYLEGRYRLDSRTEIRAGHRYRRVASKGFANKYKTQVRFEARRRVNPNTSYNFKLESFNYNEFTRGYDARLISGGIDFSF